MSKRHFLWYVIAMLLLVVCLWLIIVANTHPFLRLLTFLFCCVYIWGKSINYNNLQLYGCKYVQYSWGQNYECRYNNMYPDVAAMSNSTASIALANAFADVLSLPHSAVSVNTYYSVGNQGSGIGGNTGPMTRATLTVLYQGSAQTTADLYQTKTKALTMSDRSNAHRMGSLLNAVSKRVDRVDRSLQNQSPAPTPSPTRSSSSTYPTRSPSSAPSSSAPSSATILTEYGIYNALNKAANDFMNYRNSHQSSYSIVDNLSPLGIALRTYGFPNLPFITGGNVQTMSSSSYISPTRKPTSTPSTSEPTIKDAPTKPPAKLTGAPSDVLPPLDGKNFVLPGLGNSIVLSHDKKFGHLCTLCMTLSFISIHAV